MISIIIPVYNVEQYIENTIKSLLNQTYCDYELIFVNDGSTDNTSAIIRQTLSDSSAKWKIIDKENGGQSSAKNCGYSNSIGEYVLFMDSDEIVAPLFLEKLLSLFSDTVDFTFCNFRYVKEQVPPIDGTDDSIILNRDELLNLFLRRKINFVAPSLLIRRSFIEENRISFNEEIRFSEDQMYIWDLFFRCNLAAYTSCVLYGYYLREKSIMTASPYEKIKKGALVFDNYCENLLKLFPNDSSIIKMIFPRWSLGALYTSAKLVTYEEFKSLYAIMDGKQILNKLQGIKDARSILLATLAKLSQKLLYIACRII